MVARSSLGRARARAVLGLLCCARGFKALHELIAVDSFEGEPVLDGPRERENRRRLLEQQRLVEDALARAGGRRREALALWVVVWVVRCVEVMRRPAKLGRGVDEILPRA